MSERIMSEGSNNNSEVKPLKTTLQDRVMDFLPKRVKTWMAIGGVATGVAIGEAQTVKAAAAGIPTDKQGNVEPGPATNDMGKSSFDVVRPKTGEVVAQVRPEDAFYKAAQRKDAQATPEPIAPTLTPEPQKEGVNPFPSYIADLGKASDLGVTDAEEYYTNPNSKAREVVKTNQVSKDYQKTLTDLCGYFGEQTGKQFYPGTFVAIFPNGELVETGYCVSFRDGDQTKPDTYGIYSQEKINGKIVNIRAIVNMPDNLVGGTLLGMRPINMNDGTTVYSPDFINSTTGESLNLVIGDPSDAIKAQGGASGAGGNTDVKPVTYNFDAQNGKFGIDGAVSKPELSKLPSDLSSVEVTYDGGDVVDPNILAALQSVGKNINVSIIKFDASSQYAISNGYKDSSGNLLGTYKVFVDYRNGKVNVDIAFDQKLSNNPNFMSTLLPVFVARTIKVAALEEYEGKVNGTFSDKKIREDFSGKYTNEELAAESAHPVIPVVKLTLK